MQYQISTDYGELRVEMTGGFPFLHLQISKWSHNIFKKRLLPLWVTFLEDMKQQGFNAIYACIDKTDTKTLKFHSMVGMTPWLEDDNCIITRRVI